jgi:hypothetical protein
VSFCAYNTETLTFEGRDFEVALYSDTDTGPPWEECDGYGSIRTVYGSGLPSKLPGEVIIHADRGTYWLYDFKGATEEAKRDGWGLSDTEKAKLAKKLGREPTAGQIRQEAVKRAMDFCRRWLNDDWWWIGVCVRIIGPGGEPEGDEFEHALWGVESDGDYWKEVAEELAGDILHEKRKAWRAALRERRERRYWASRDIVTV